MLDLNKLKKFLRKKYRDSYLQSNIRVGIAYQIKALRAKFELSQEEFAQRTDKKQSVISRLENTEYGRVSVQTLLDIACAMDVALVVRFVDYPTFFRFSEDMSEKAMQPATVYQSFERAQQLAFEFPSRVDRGLIKIEQYQSSGLRTTFAKFFTIESPQVYNFPSLNAGKLATGNINLSM